jgi:hypothetical protein
VWHRLAAGERTGDPGEPPILAFDRAGVET